MTNVYFLHFGFKLVLLMDLNTAQNPVMACFYIFFEFALKLLVVMPIYK